MTAHELMFRTLQAMGYDADAQMVEEWRDKLMRYLNDAVIDLFCVLKPTRTDKVEIQKGIVDLTALSHRCIKVLSVSFDGIRSPFYYGVGIDRIHVPLISSGEVMVTYRYLPNNMLLDNDEPDLQDQNGIEDAIVLYTVGRVYAIGEGDSIAKARAIFELYEMAKKRLREPPKEE